MSLTSYFRALLASSAGPNALSANPVESIVSSGSWTEFNINKKGSCLPAYLPQAQLFLLPPCPSVSILSICHCLSTELCVYLTFYLPGPILLFASCDLSLPLCLADTLSFRHSVFAVYSYLHSACITATDCSNSLQKSKWSQG